MHHGMLRIFLNSGSCQKLALASISRLSHNTRPSLLNGLSVLQCMRHQFYSRDAVNDSHERVSQLATGRTSRTTTKLSLRRVVAQRDGRFLEMRRHLPVQPCVALTVADSYDLPKAIELLHAAGHLNASMLLPDDVAFVKYPTASGYKADIFILSNGSIVTFGMYEVDSIKVADILANAEIRSYPTRESEDLDYIEYPPEHGSENAEEEPVKRSFMDGDIICIRGHDRILDKAAFASGIARSTKLAVLELNLEEYIKSVRDITDNLASGRKLPIHDGREILKRTGELLTLRGNLNLYSELAELPDLYWSEPELESLYKAVSKNLDITPRISILNKKLDYVIEVVSIMKAHISEEKSVRLEWMIILLIMVEVAFETCHFIERYCDYWSPSANKHERI
ncbi:hypothetical protein V1511DRAFT_506129 [Dipodascopsis uninucleata]